MQLRRGVKKENRQFSAEWYAILTAVLFGITAPLAKLLLSGMGPVTLSASVFAGGALVLTCYYLWTRRTLGGRTAEAPLKKADIPWIAASILIGYVGATMLLMVSLQYTPAATASLLLSFEGVITTLIAVFIFREQVGLRIVIALGLITTACLLIACEPETTILITLGSTGVLLACCAWGIDTNISRHLSGKDPALLNCIRAWAAAGILSLFACVLGEPVPSLSFLFSALILGIFSFSGIAAIWFLKALRGLGAARTGSIIGMNPVLGILVSIFIFQTVPDPVFLIAFISVIIGLVFLSSEDHVHMHMHDAKTHEHSHHHIDGHHDHTHTVTDPPVTRTGYHSHSHHHGDLVHSHPHRPDIHHRHRHGRSSDGVFTGSEENK